VRIASLNVSNYRGIESASLTDIASEPVVMISGRNGTGKSLLLEALVATWRGIPLDSRRGPYGEEVKVDVRVALNDGEKEAVARWTNEIDGRALASDTHQLTVVARRRTRGEPVHDPVIDVLRHAEFKANHPFAVLDYLPAVRRFPATNTAVVDLDSLNPDALERGRTATLDAVLQHRQVDNLPNLAGHLVTLDYQNYLAERQGLEISDDYERLAAAFKAATGKELRPPAYDPNTASSTIRIELADGTHHGLQELSSGERELLGLLLHVRRLASAGGVFILDEPEQHLHPTLQAALLDSVEDLSDHGQMLIVSHSVNMIAAAPPSGLVQMVEAGPDSRNQIVRLREQPERLQLIAELGITPADLLQNDFLCVVEGESDERWLRTVMPTEFGRAHVIHAGGSHAVLAAHRTLTLAPQELPWLCILDRDFRDADSVAALCAQHPNLFVWDRREIESAVIDGALLADVLTINGRATTIDDAWTALHDAADPLRNDVLEAMVEDDLRRRFPGEPGDPEGSRWHVVAERHRAFAAVHTERATGVQESVASQTAELDARWADEWIALVDPKVLFERLHAVVAIHSSADQLLAALFTRAKIKTLTPSPIRSLQVRVANALR
jgi:predicted ATPase